MHPKSIQQFLSSLSSKSFSISFQKFSHWIAKVFLKLIRNISTNFPHEIENQQQKKKFQRNSKANSSIMFMFMIRLNLFHFEDVYRLFFLKLQ